MLAVKISFRCIEGGDFRKSHKFSVLPPHVMEQTSENRDGCHLKGAGARRVRLLGGAAGLLAISEEALVSLNNGI